jgi:hypothetical protein
MTYDQQLAMRVRSMLSEVPNLEEKVMFGGVGFMLHGNMACGVLGDELVVRVGAEGHDQALKHEHVREFDFTGRPMRGWICVSPEGIGPEQSLQGWIDLGISFARSLPKK